MEPQFERHHLPNACSDTVKGIDMAAAWMAAAVVTMLHGTSWVGPAETPVQISFEAGKAHGALSCNQFQTSYDENDAALGFGGIATTRKGCAPDRMQKERLVLKLLTATASYVVEGDRLVLKDAGGKTILTLKRKA
jgi:heat shock protein HslJ